MLEARRYLLTSNDYLFGLFFSRLLPSFNLNLSVINHGSFASKIFSLDEALSPGGYHWIQI